MVFRQVNCVNTIPACQIHDVHDLSPQRDDHSREAEHETLYNQSPTHSPMDHRMGLHQRVSETSQ